MVGVTVQEEVNALHLLQQVAGPVGLGGGIHTQVADADDQVTAMGGEGVHLVLGAGVQLFPGQEGEALDPGGVGRGSGLRGGQAKDADAVVGGVDDCVGRGDGLALIKDVGSQGGKLCRFQKGSQGLIAVVELVVAQGDQVVSGQIHELHRRGTLGKVHIGVALAEVTGVHQVDVGPGGLVPLLQGGHSGVAVDAAVDVVGVEDEGVSRQVIGVFRPDLSGSCGNGQGKGHHQRQEQSKQSFRHTKPSFSLI